MTTPRNLNFGSTRPAPSHRITPPSKQPYAVVSGVSIWCAHEECMSVEELEGRKHPRNDNKHDDTQTLFLAQAIRKHGFRRAIVISRLSGKIIAGHGALKAAKSVGMTHCPVTYQDFSSANEELAHLMADNELARLSYRDELQTGENLSILKQGGYDLSLTGILEDERIDLLRLVGGDLQGEEEVGKAGNARKPGERSKVDSMDEVSDVLEGAKSLKDDMVFMPSGAPFDIPELRLDMCMAIPEPFDSWAGPDGSPPQDGMHYLYNITSVMRELPVDRSIFGFYADDHRFEVVWKSPASYASKLLNMGFMGAVTPNWSLHAGGPKATHIWNIYRSRWVGRYFQESGIKIVPDVPTAGLDSLDVIMAGIPKGLPSISLQCQTSEKSAEEIRIRRAMYAEIERQLEPETILVYGGDHTEKYLHGCFKHARPIHILNRMQKRRAVISRNASGAAKMNL